VFIFLGRRCKLQIILNVYCNFTFIIFDIPNNTKWEKRLVDNKVLHKIIRIQEISLAFRERKIFISTAIQFNFVVVCVDFLILSFNA